jgi:hypothetical protein
MKPTRCGLWRSLWSNAVSPCHFLRLAVAPACREASPARKRTPTRMIRAATMQCNAAARQRPLLRTSGSRRATERRGACRSRTARRVTFTSAGTHLPLGLQRVYDVNLGRLLPCDRIRKPAVVQNQADISAIRRVCHDVHYGTLAPS